MLRIRKTRWKVVYVAAAVALVSVANGLVFTHVLPYPLDAIAGNVLLLLVYFGGTRAFRGRGEPLAPPRDWWRMTSRPAAGFVIGSLLVLSAAWSISSAVTGPGDQLLTSVLNAATDGLLAVLYFRSSVLLRRHPLQAVAEPIPLPKWKPVKR